jgi:hypothetical protein
MLCGPCHVDRWFSGVKERQPLPPAGVREHRGVETGDSWAIHRRRHSTERASQQHLERRAHISTGIASAVFANATIEPVCFGRGMCTYTCVDETSWTLGGPFRLQGGAGHTVIIVGIGTGDETEHRHLSRPMMAEMLLYITFYDAHSSRTAIGAIP